MKMGCLLVALWIFSWSANASRSEAFKVLFYNVENLFDCENDTLKNDEEFLPGGLRGWNYSRYVQKMGNIARVIVTAGEWDVPALVGLCEVENRRTLLDLTTRSPLKNAQYRFIHYESPDMRGIDVALLYQQSLFRPFAHRAIPVRFAGSTTSSTRDILYVGGIMPTGDTLHVFVCHFPSRLSGELETEPRRKQAASVLRNAVDSLFAIHGYANILLMGDFNDYPCNASLYEVLQAKEPAATKQASMLYNLAYALHKSGGGTHKFQGKWGALDQIIVSGGLLHHPTFKIHSQQLQVVKSSFLLEPDPTYFGYKPFRTYQGFRYQGGYSDHLPIMVQFTY